ncbi:MAG: polysaccharide deacetylase family protein [Eubacteriales bacterium]
MKKIISVFLLSFIFISSLFQEGALASAPPTKDGVVFSGTTACGKKIALTFDDGPHPYKTRKILDILDKYGVKATFFIIGVNAEKYPQIVLEEVSRGHEVGNHSYSHTRLSKCTPEEVKNEIDKTDRIILNAAGVKPRLFRPPEGAYSPEIVKTAAELEKTTIIWTVDTLDWAKASCEDIVKNIKTNIRYGSIILFHDFTGDGTHTADALEKIIPYLKNEGYEFVTVSELLAGE